MRRACRVVLVSVLVLGGLPAVASAALAPRWVLGDGEGQGMLAIAGSKIKAGATAPSTFKCNRVNAVVPKAIKIVHGKFSYKGKMKGNPGTLVFKGRFNTAGTRVTGKATITNGKCTSTRKFSAVPFVEPAPPTEDNVPPEPDAGPPTDGE